MARKKHVLTDVDETMLSTPDSQDRLKIRQGDAMKEATERPRRGYDPSVTAEVKKAAVSEIVCSAADMLRKAPVRTDLRDLDAVRTVAGSLMQECIRIGVLPSVEMLAAWLGHSRQSVYKFLAAHPEIEATTYLDMLRTGWAALRIAAADRGAVSETVSIFLLLNSSLGFTNVHQVELSQPPNPMENLDPEAARRRLMESMPDVYMDED